MSKIYWDNSSLHTEYNECGIIKLIELQKGQMQFKAAHQSDAHHTAYKAIVLLNSIFAKPFSNILFISDQNSNNQDHTKRK